MQLVQGRGIMAVLPVVTAVCFITFLWICILTVVLLIQGRGEMAGQILVTAVLLLHCAMDTRSDIIDVSTG